jgi:nucleoside-diphosphate-sugar epimerase
MPAMGLIKNPSCKRISLIDLLFLEVLIKNGFLKDLLRKFLLSSGDSIILFSQQEDSQMVIATKRILVTGATGQIGSELTLELRKKCGKNNVVAAGHKRRPNPQLSESGPFEYVDTLNQESIKKVVEVYDIDTIYHLAAVLSAVGEESPQLAWHVNMDGLYNVLEVARENGPQRVFWPSSIAAFGHNAPRVNTPQEASLIPRSMYGVTKVAGELLCNYYFLKYGLDVRSLRYPGIISSETLPGGGTTDYAVEIFYEAVKKKRYTCFVREDTVLPMMFMPDCIKATTELMEADAGRIKTRTSYNINGMSFSAGEIAAEIKKHIPEFVCEYKPDSRQKIADSWPMSLDDGAARREWGWKPKYDLAAMTDVMIEVLTKRYREGKI